MSLTNNKIKKESGLAEMFRCSAKSLSELRTLLTSGLLVAMAIALRSAAFQITPDVRVSLQFLPICVIAMLYGPVVCMVASFATDLIGFLFDASGRFYSPQLASVVILSGLIYGVFLYRKKNDGKLFFSALTSRTIVVILCNICLNSYFIYTLFVNKNFSLLDFSGYKAFLIWVTPRIVVNIGKLPFDFALLCLILPLANAAYERIRKEFAIVRK
ncbi:MAG: folate family ECF transporter S component [Oscillospiraceae bacterium]|nr:folate family ECF transporter S component [Oscillospiraceae bacterium]